MTAEGFDFSDGNLFTVLFLDHIKYYFLFFKADFGSEPPPKSLRGTGAGGRFADERCADSYPSSFPHLRLGANLLERITTIVVARVRAVFPRLGQTEERSTESTIEQLRR